MMGICENILSFRYIVAPSSNDKHAKNAVVGQYLQGTMTLAKVRYFNFGGIFYVSIFLR